MTRTFLLLSLLLLISISPATPYESASAAEFDLVIVGGRIVDGTGNPWFEGDVAISGGKIVEIGKIDPARASRKIYAQGLIVAPGFIDVHTHIENGIEERPDAENFLMMGVTSVVTGNCGGSKLNLKEWFETIEKGGIGINVASLVGHNTIRHEAMGGDFNRPPGPDELARMRDLVERGMKDGAVGFSTGLEYIPGTYATTDEIVQLAKVAARYSGIYATHMRDEGEFIEKSVAESIAVGDLAGCPVEISHFKISSKKRWGASSTAIKLVEDARARGVEVTVDQYLYPASSTGIGILFPSWVFEGGRVNLEERLKDPSTRERVGREVIEKAIAQGFSDLSFAYVANYKADPSFNGQNLAEITRRMKNRTDAASQADQAIDILIAGGAQMVLRKMSEEDVGRIFKQPFTMVASDAGVIDPEGASVPHPRGFGNNARALGVYVRQQNLITLPEAIRRMTSLPAQTFKLWGRGVIRPGMAADLVLLDEKAISDRATFEQPKRYPIGIEYVIVNGKVVIERSVYTHTRAGTILRGKGLPSDFKAAKSSAEEQLRIRDEMIFRRFYRLQREWKYQQLSRQQYLDALRALQAEELKLFEDARKLEFKDMLEHEYWHRSRMKFPSPVAQEINLLAQEK